MDDADETTPGAELTDSALRQEIELLGELMASAAAALQPLGQAEIDRALHVTPATSDAEAPPDPGPGAHPLR